MAIHGTSDIACEHYLADVDFHDVLILYHIVRFDSCSRMKLAPPDSREFEALGEIPVY